jgi:hypothetical protein
MEKVAFELLLGVGALDSEDKGDISPGAKLRTSI